MTKLNEEKINITFNLAGYGLDVIDYTDLHNSIMLMITEKVSMFAVLGNFDMNIKELK